MITINLLDTRLTGDRDRAPRSAWRTASVLAAVVVVTALVAAWAALRTEQTHLRTLIAAAAGLRTAMGDPGQAADRLRARRLQLLEHASFVTHLNAEGSSVFALLALAAESVPDGLWLTELSRKAGRLEVSGRASSIDAIALFAANLRDSVAPKGVVDIRSASAEVVEQVPVFRFQIVAGLE